MIAVMIHDASDVIVMIAAVMIHDPSYVIVMIAAVMIHDASDVAGPAAVMIHDASYSILAPVSVHDTPDIVETAISVSIIHYINLPSILT
jgi:hypothetical protein